MKRVAILIGATGLVGSALLDQLLEDEDYEKIIVLHRRSTGIGHSKLEEHIIDFDHPKHWKELVKGDVLFSTLGTTIKTAGSKDVQYKVDFTYQYETAKAAAENGVKTYVLVSSAGSNANSKMFYPRIKGELEEAVKKLSFHSINILQPSILDGNRKEFRFGEKVGLIVMKALSWIPGIRKYRPIKDEIVASAMRYCSSKNSEGINIYTLDEIFDLI